MSLLTMFLEREGIAGGVATYGNIKMRIPKESWERIKNNKLMISSGLNNYFQNHKNVYGGKKPVKIGKTLSEYCVTESDGSGLFDCYTVEDIPRAVKIKHETCIPAGVYPVTLVTSGKFGEACPAINNVTGFDEIRIHCGLSSTWSSGCVIIGFERVNKNTMLSSSGSATVVLFNLLSNLQKIGNTFNIDIRFLFEPKEQLPVKVSPDAIDVSNTKTQISNGMAVVTNSNNYQSIGEAGDCGCYSLSEFDPSLDGDYATQNTKKFFDLTANNVYNLVKNKVDIKSYTNGSIVNGVSVIPVTQDVTVYSYNVPKKDDLILKLEEYTHGKRLDIKSKESAIGTVKFDISFTRTMKYEGEYIFDPIDSASERKYGLSFNHDSEILKQHNVNKIVDLTLSEARTIYQEKYWTPYELSSLNNQDVADLMFDIMVSCGIDNGQKVIRKAIRDNYGVQAPDATTWHEYMVVAKYVESPRFVGELLEARINHQKSFLKSHPEAIKYYEEWNKRCEDYRVEIASEDINGENKKYFEQIFKAIDSWLKGGAAENGIIHSGTHLTYSNSTVVQTFVPPQIYRQIDFPFVIEWGKVCQKKIDSKTDWPIDPVALMEAQWNIVAECMEKALNRNIVPTESVLGTSVSGQFTGSVTTLLIWTNV